MRPSATLAWNIVSLILPTSLNTQNMSSSYFVRFMKSRSSYRAMAVSLYFFVVYVLVYYRMQGAVTSGMFLLLCYFYDVCITGWFYFISHHKPLVYLSTATNAGSYCSASVTNTFVQWGDWSDFLMCKNNGICISDHRERGKERMWMMIMSVYRVLTSCQAAVTANPLPRQQKRKLKDDLWLKCHLLSICCHRLQVKWEKLWRWDLYFVPISVGRISISRLAAGMQCHLSDCWLCDSYN